MIARDYFNQGNSNIWNAPRILSALPATKPPVDALEFGVYLFQCAKNYSPARRIGHWVPELITHKRFMINISIPANQKVLQYLAARNPTAALLAASKAHSIHITVSAAIPRLSSTFGRS
jgi:hypothetical protein